MSADKYPDIAEQKLQIYVEPSKFVHQRALTISFFRMYDNYVGYL